MPAITDRSSALSRTVRVIGPSTDSVGHPRKPGNFGTSPNVGLSPTIPQKHDGILIEPPPSVPTESGAIPAATAAPDPPLDPPGVRSRFHGFLVSPNTALSVNPR